MGGLEELTTKYKPAFHYGTCLWLNFGTCLVFHPASVVINVLGPSLAYLHGALTISVSL